jgi:hypothetical protein
VQLCHPIAIDLYDVNVEKMRIYVNKGGKSTWCGVIPLSISYNKSLVILSRKPIYKLNVLYVYMCIDETIIKNK